MNKRQIEQRGFGVVELLILAVVVAVIAAIGFLVFNNLQNNDKASTTRSTDQSADTKLKEYKNKDYGFSLQYPSSWKVTEALEDGGRGVPEGLITISSPSGTSININANLGGKGGDCLDDQANDQRTTRTCMTLETLKLEQFDSGRDGINLYLYHDKLTPATLEGSVAQYRVGVRDNQNGTPKIGSELTAVGSHVINTGKGDLIIHITSKDDDANQSASFFETAAVKEAVPVLKSLRLTSN